MTREEVVLMFQSKPYMVTMGCRTIAKRLNTSEDVVRQIKAETRRNMKDFGTTYHPKEVVINHHPTISKNVLIIGDTHLPYEKDGYLEFCIEQYNKWNCDTVVHIGDLIDSHATSRHPSVPDAYGPGDELEYTIKKLSKWYEAFPNMKVCIGNHDIRAYKIASENRLASR